MTREEEIKFRDECAMRVMQKLFVYDCSDDVSKRTDFAKDIAQRTFEMADTMLEEKKKRDEK